MKAVDVPPCFFQLRCGNRAEISKQGKAVCKRCAASLGGEEYPLRDPADYVFPRLHPNFWATQFVLRGRTVG